MSELTEIESTAYHEAGHAVASILTGKRFKYITIIPEGDSLGHIRHFGLSTKNLDEYDITPRVRVKIETDIMIYLSGEIAENHFSGIYNDKCALRDNQTAANLASFVTSSIEETNAYISWLWVRAKDSILLPAHWSSVQALAAALLEKKIIKYSDCCEIVRKAILKR